MKVLSGLTGLCRYTRLSTSRQFGPALAYISGSLRTLIGAGLLNIKNLQGLGVPAASIGGAGTFDGIFLTDILAVLLSAGLAGRSHIAEGSQEDGLRFTSYQARATRQY